MPSRTTLWLALTMVLINALTALPHAQASEVTADICLSDKGRWRAADENVNSEDAKCVELLTELIALAPSGSLEQARLLNRRGGFRITVADRLAKGNPARLQMYQAGLEDLRTALAIAPDNKEWRTNYVMRLLRLDRLADALREVEEALSKNPSDLDFISLKGSVLIGLKRFDDAIKTYDAGLVLTEQCAEGSALQDRLNAIRHAYDPPPPREEIERQIREQDIELYGVPEPGIKALGFRCTSQPRAEFEHKVVMRRSLIAGRGRAYEAMGDRDKALTDYKYSELIDSLSSVGSIELCSLEIDMKLYYDAVEHCRSLVDYNVSIFLDDDKLTYKIANFLLEDGDLKGACRLALSPFRSRPGFSKDPQLRQLQLRLRKVLRAAGMNSCEREMAVPPK